MRTILPRSQNDVHGKVGSPQPGAPPSSVPFSLFRSAPPAPYSPRSVEFRTEIGSVPARDRSGSAPRSVQIRSRVNSADMNVPGSGIGSDSTSGHGRPLRRVRVTSDQAFGLAESRSRISVRSSMSVTFLASSSAFSLAMRSLIVFVGMTMAK